MTPRKRNSRLPRAFFEERPPDFVDAFWIDFDKIHPHSFQFSPSTILLRRLAVFRFIESCDGVANPKPKDGFINGFPHRKDRN